MANAFANPIPERKIKNNYKPIYGVSFSFEQAGWYGLNPKEEYTRLLDEFKFSWIRLPYFWNQDNLSDLKFAVEEARKRNINVIIALGAKTPYFPEYHWPKEIAAKVKFGENLDINSAVAKDILEIDKKVVGELSSYDNIIYWQVENEPLIGNVNRWKIDPSLIAEEIKVVRETDPRNRPIILNHAAAPFFDRSWQKLLPILKKGDIFAVNAFFKTKGTDLLTAKVFGREIHILWPDHLVWPVHSWAIFSPNFKTIKKEVEKKGLKFWVLEMQAEPYIKKLEEASDPLLTFTPQDIERVDKFLRSYEIESIGLWGAHFWLYQQNRGNSAWIETVKKIVND